MDLVLVFRSQSPDEIDQLPTLLFSQERIEGRHRRARVAVGDPFKKLPVGVYSG